MESVDLDEIRVGLEEFFIESATAIKERMHELGISQNMSTTRQAIVRNESSVHSRPEEITENTLRSREFMSAMSPWLADDHIDRVRVSVDKLVETSEGTLPFNISRSPGYFPVVHSQDSLPPSEIDYRNDRVEWIMHYLIYPALQFHLESLPRIDQLVESQASTFATDVMTVACDTRMRYKVSIPIDSLAPEGAKQIDIREEGIVFRTLSTEEQSHWMQWSRIAGTRGFGDIFFPQAVLEYYLSGPRNDDEILDTSKPTRFVQALQFHGFEPLTRLIALQSVPSWLSMGESHQPYLVQEYATRTATLKENELLDVARTAKLLVKYSTVKRYQQHRLAIDRFVAGVARSHDSDALIDFTVALENLLLPYDPETRHSNLSYRFRMHGAHYLSRALSDRVEVSKNLGEIYKARSALVHGGSKEAASLKTETFENAREYARRGLLRAMHEGFPGASEFNKMILGVAEVD